MLRDKKINPGDHLRFRENNLAWPAEEKTWKYSKGVQRVIYKDDPIDYVKKSVVKGKIYHYFKSMGLCYVYCGPYRDFRKVG